MAFFLFVIFAVDVAVATQQNKVIYDKIFTNYNKLLRPVKSEKNLTVVRIDSGLYSIDEISELTQTFTVTVWQKLKWKDELLTWKPSEFGNIKEIHVPASVVWVPDIVITGLTEVISALPDIKTIGGITYDGSVRMTFLQVSKIHCDFNIKRFPFDTQNCSIIYSSWDYDLTKLDIVPIENGFGTKHFQENAEWELQSYVPVRKELKTDDASYVEMHYQLTIKRRPVYYIFALVVPSFVITMVAFVGLFSPFSSTGERQEKVSMGLTTLLTMSVLLLIVVEQMPKSAEMGLPLLGNFILFEILIASFATSLTVVIMWLHRMSVYGKHPPHWLLRFLLIPENRKEDEAKNGQIPQKEEVLRLESIVPEQTSTPTPSESSVQTVNKRKQIVPGKKKGKPGLWKRKVLGSQNQPKPFDRQFSQLSTFVVEKQRDQQLAEVWRKVADRIDLIMLCFFLTFNIIVSVVMLFIVGFALG